tara:strand:- start:5524 stop:6297 length:774 start_codon:yes stop_codon:yes gene_type:complete
MDEKNKKDLVNNLLDTFRHAAKISMDLREKGLKETLKNDNTPVTNGDIEVNNILIKKIESLTPQIPIISEEVANNKNLKNLSTFWLIDPIDGTYDYINGKDEFTINAALIINKIPEIGIINAPAKKRLFYSYSKNNSFEESNNETKKLMANNGVNDNIINAVSYSNELKPEIKKFHEKFNVKKFIRMKSSLKFCVVASGEYDLYVAEPRACEWDIAAGDAIVRNAGGTISDFDGNKIFYGKKDFKNSSLILKGSKLK